jgi:hypothetical protein
VGIVGTWLWAIKSATYAKTDSREHGVSSILLPFLHKTSLGFPISSFPNLDSWVHGFLIDLFCVISGLLMIAEFEKQLSQTLEEI